MSQCFINQKQIMLIN